MQAVIRKRGGRHLLPEVWAHPDGAEPSRGSLKLAFSYADDGVVPDFYNIPALEGHVCQICGTPCRCGARIAVLHLFPGIGVNVVDVKNGELARSMKKSSRIFDNRY